MCVFVSEVLEMRLYSVQLNIFVFGNQRKTSF